MKDVVPALREWVRRRHDERYALCDIATAEALTRRSEWLKPNRSFTTIDNELLQLAYARDEGADADGTASSLDHLFLKRHAVRVPVLVA